MAIERRSPDRIVRRLTRRANRPAAPPAVVVQAPTSLASSQPAANYHATVETILQHIHDAIFATDVEGSITFWAPSAQALFEYTEQQAVGARFRDLLPSQIAEPSSPSDFDATVAAGRTWRGEGSVVVPSGRVLWLESAVSPIVVDGIVRGTVSVSRDMTATHVAERELEDRAVVFRALSEYAAVASAIRDEATLAPALIAAVSGVIPSDYVVLSLLDPATGRYHVRATHGADGALGAEIRPGEGSAGRAIAARTLVVVERLNRSSYGPATRDVIPDGELTTAAVPLIHDGVVLGTMTAARPAGALPFSATERDALSLFAAHAALAVANVRLLDEISELAVHDGLTGLYNRRHFDASLDLLLARWRRGRNPAEPVAAVMFDLDRFGKLNRDHGHQSGDAVLRAFGGILHERLRSSDLVARYGGEEFVAVLERTSLADAVDLADLIRETLEARAVAGPDGITIRATVSAGVAVLDAAEPTAQALLRAADIGLFMAKRSGRNRVVTA